MSKDKPPLRSILSDHRKVGNRFIPPFLHRLPGPFQETKWIDTGLPELFWLALLNDQLGLQRGAELAVETARRALAIHKGDQKVWFAATSAFLRLDDQQRQALAADLRSAGFLPDLRQAICPLVHLYPECPLAFLAEPTDISAKEKDIYLFIMRRLLDTLFDKTTQPAIRAQANGVYVAFATDMLVVPSDSDLAKFPAVEQYPYTEQSKRIAASIRVTTSAFFGFHTYDSSTPWPRYFWNRGLQLQGCEFNRMPTDE